MIALLEYVLLRAFMLLVWLLPQKITDCIVEVLISLAVRLDKRHARQAAKNIQKLKDASVIPSETESTKLLKNSYRLLIRSAFDILNIKRKIQFSIDGLDNLKGVLATGKGAIVCLGHFDGWEVFARGRTLFADLTIGTVYRRINNKWLDRYILSQRSAYGVKLFEKSTSWHNMIAFVKEGGVLGIYADQYAGDNGVWTPFLGRLASITPAPAILAIKAGVSVSNISPSLKSRSDSSPPTLYTKRKYLSA